MRLAIHLRDRARALLLAVAFAISLLSTQAHLLSASHVEAIDPSSGSVTQDHDGDDDHDDGDEDHEGPQHSPHSSSDHLTVATAPTSSSFSLDLLALEPATPSFFAALALDADVLVLVLPDDDPTAPPTPHLSLSRPRSPPAA